MSRFMNPAVARPKSAKPAAGAAPAAKIVQPPAAKPVLPQASVQAQPQVRLNMLQKLGFLSLCIYSIAPLLNDLAVHLFGVAPRLTLVPLGVLLLCTVLGGQFGRGFKHSSGRWWFGFLVCMVVSTVFSYWVGGSREVVQDFAIKRYSMFFCICAAMVTIRQCISYAYINVLSTLLILLLCFKFGEVSSADGRFFINESLFFEGSNDLAIALLVSALGLIFVFFTSSTLLKLIAAGEIAGCLVYLLKTGSRGTFLAVIVSAICIILFGKKRALMAALVVPSMLLLVVLLPSSTWRRLTSIVADPRQAILEGEGGGDVESQLERQELLKRSIRLTFQHPVLGVGPGMFPEVVEENAKKLGQHEAWLNTHNTYTQISSECGLPALLCYLATMIIAGRLNYRMYRYFSAQSGSVNTQASGLAFSGFICIIGFAFASIFHHVGYGGSVAWMGGQTLALWFTLPPEARNANRLV